MKKPPPRRGRDGGGLTAVPLLLVTHQPVTAAAAYGYAAGRGPLSPYVRRGSSPRERRISPASHRKRFQPRRFLSVGACRTATSPSCASGLRRLHRGEALSPCLSIIYHDGAEIHRFYKISPAGPFRPSDTSDRSTHTGSRRSPSAPPTPTSARSPQPAAG